MLQVISGLKMKPGFCNPQVSILLSLNLFHYRRQAKREIINSRMVWAEKANSEDRRKLCQTLPCLIMKLHIHAVESNFEPGSQMPFIWYSVLELIT